MKLWNKVRSLEREKKTLKERLQICEMLIDIFGTYIDLEGKPGDAAKLAESLGKKREKAPPP